MTARQTPCLDDVVVASSAPVGGAITPHVDRRAARGRGTPDMALSLQDKWQAWIDTHYNYDRHGYLPECSSEAMEEFAAATPGVTTEDIERLLAEGMANL